MHLNSDQRDSGASGASAKQEDSKKKDGESMQNTQYDQIGTKYLQIKELPAVEPEVLSICAALGEGVVRGMRCLDLACGTGKYTHLLHTLGATSVTGLDISPTMISSAKSLYPTCQYPTIHFDIADCSVSSSLPTLDSKSFDLIFSAWFLNYAGSATELTNMFHVIGSQMRSGGRFVGLTTDAHDPHMQVPKPNFYGLDVEVLDPAYVAPGTEEVLGIKARVIVGGGKEKGGFEFDVFQFRKDVYERCAREAGFEIVWRALVVPDDERRDTGFWDEWLERPTFSMLEARRMGSGSGSEL